MSARRRSGRGKGGGGNNAGGNGGGSPSGGAPKGGQGGQGGGKAKAKKAVDFWEVPGAVPAELAVAVRVPDDPTVLVRSLGAPALPGQGANAEHYFTAVYDKASHVAYALAVANGLLADADDPVGTGSSTGSDTDGEDLDAEDAAAPPDAA
jgi:hypothetical protein